MAKQRDPRRAKGKRRRKGDGATLPSVANHPTGHAQVKRAKGWAGLIGFALVALVSWSAGVPFQDMVLRALAGGIVAYLVVWACAVALWRHLVLTELEVVRSRRAAEDAARRAGTAAPEQSGAEA